MRDTWDVDTVERWAACFDWHGVDRNFRWALPEALRAVKTYLHHYKMPYWRIIEAASLRGYSLFLHEWVEIQKMHERGANELNEAEQRANFNYGHSWALLFEHRLLQAAARSEGYEFSLRELVDYNPHGEKPSRDWDGDWKLLLEELPSSLTEADKTLTKSKIPAVLDFYNRHGFREVTYA
jgi:hypothetical protein